MSKGLHVGSPPMSLSPLTQPLYGIVVQQTFLKVAYTRFTAQYLDFVISGELPRDEIGVAYHVRESYNLEDAYHLVRASGKVMALLHTLKMSGLDRLGRFWGRKAEDREDVIGMNHLGLTDDHSAFPLTDVDLVEALQFAFPLFCFGWAMESLGFLSVCFHRTRLCSRPLFSQVVCFLRSVYAMDLFTRWIHMGFLLACSLCFFALLRVSFLAI